jgi:hypothetical protein
VKNCKHGGKLSLWPPFNSKELDPEAFVMPLSEQQLFERELTCFHTKLAYKGDKNAPIKNESCLGILLNVTKVPRTG